MSNVAVRETGKQITQEENRLEEVKIEVEKQTQTRNALLAEINKKSSDFDIYMAQRDSEIKKMRSDMMAEREQLLKEKSEFQEILVSHKQAKASLEQGIKDLEIQKSRFAATSDNVNQFITAVRRASGLLGI